MKQALLCRLLVGALILVIRSDGIHGILGGSKKCPDLSLQSLQAISPNYRRLHILNGNGGDLHNSLLKCRVISVKFLVGSGDESLSKGTLRRWFTKRDNNRLQLAVREYLPEDAKVIVELNYKGRKCFLSSYVNSAVNDETKQYKRKLLSLKSNSRYDDNQQGSIGMLSALMAVTAVVSLIVVLAMCACGKNNVEKTLSDEVGGTDFDHQVVGVSSINKEHQVKGEIDKRTDTGNSKNSETISTRENGGTRTASHSSQQNDLRVERTSRLDSSGSHSSTKITQASAPSENAKKVEETSLKAANFESERVRSQSTKEQSSQQIEPGDTRGFSQSDTFVYKGNEANIATPTQGRKQPVQLVSRKGSDKGKERDGSHKSKKGWLRRKSSKNKSDENPSSKDDKKTTSRHSDLPLPPTPESKDAPGLIEENQYEIVERKTTNKAAEVNKATNLSRPSSELYACIDEEDKLKRNSSEVHMYDVVEVRGKPPPKVASDTSGLEYAYSVVAPKDKPIQPSQTSSGSGLYEVVSDDMKKNIHVPLVQDDNDYDYAVVQKDSSKKKSLIPITNHTRPLSDTDLAPAPPPVIGLPSIKRRAQSEGDNLHVLPDKAAMLNEPETSVEVEHTYAKVNKQRKSVHKEKQKDTVTPDNFCMEGLGDESEEPPPIPPSLYAELPVKDEGGAVETMTTIRADSMTRVRDTNSIEQVNSSSNVVAANIQRNSLSDVKVMCSEDKDSQLLKGSALDSEKPVTISIDASHPPSANPLYDEIHYV